MRNAKTVLDIIRKRGEKGAYIEDLYRQLFNPELYLLAYGKIYKNDGAMTEGVTTETVDDMSLAKIHRIIEALRQEKYRWSPVRRVQIPKSNGKTRPLGIPTWSDKLLQEVMRSLLEAYYEPQFFVSSHGFRPNRGCHTALSEVQKTWKGTRWFIEGDIKGCFDNIDHSILIDVLRKQVHDGRFIRLVEEMLKAGFLEWWVYKPTLSGTPQGGVISPLLSNIYLHQLDCFVRDVLYPRYNLGKLRRGNPAYTRVCYLQRKAHRGGDVAKAQAYRKEKQKLSRVDPYDPNYRRLKYVRYADDFLLGFAGPKVEAEEIKAALSKFLKDQLRLELSENKTLITHAKTGKANFLGYEILTQHSDSYRDYKNTRTANAVVQLRISVSTIDAYCRDYMAKGKPIHKALFTVESDFDIVNKYGSIYRGIVNYYSLASNVSWLNKLKYVMQLSMLKTLAHKHKASVKEMMLKYMTTASTENGPRRSIEVVLPRDGKRPLIARFGGISLRRKERMVVRDVSPYTASMRNELLVRLLAEQCEVCGSNEDIRVHHIRKMSDLNRFEGREKPLWAQLMAARKRKTMVMCNPCHMDLHAGRPFSRLKAA